MLMRIEAILPVSAQATAVLLLTSCQQHSLAPWGKQMMFRNHPCKPVVNSGICKIIASVFADVWRSPEQQPSLIPQLFGEDVEKKIDKEEEPLLVPSYRLAGLERKVTFCLSKPSWLHGELLSSRVPAN